MFLDRFLSLEGHIPNQTIISELSSIRVTPFSGRRARGISMCPGCGSCRLCVRVLPVRVASVVCRSPSRHGARWTQWAGCDTASDFTAGPCRLPASCGLPGHTSRSVTGWECWGGGGGGGDRRADRVHCHLTSPPQPLLPGIPLRETDTS